MAAELQPYWIILDISCTALPNLALHQYPITTGLPGTYTSARSDHYRAELRRRGSYHLAMEIREFLGRDSHAKSKKTCRPFEFRYNQLDGNDFLRSIPSDTSRVLPQVMKSTSISAQIFFAYQKHVQL